jgi:CRISPR type III-A-associated protein Csm2
MPNNIDHNILDRNIQVSDLELLEEWGKYLSKEEEILINGKQKKINALSTTQIRKFFGEMKRIQADFKNLKNEIILLDPKIAYAVGRARKDGISKLEDFYKLVSPLLRKIKEDEKRFKNFVKIIESIVAYHRANEVNKK